MTRAISPWRTWGEPMGKRSDTRKEGFRGECAVSACMVLDLVMVDAHQHREVPLPVCRNSQNRRFPSFCPRSERDDVEVNPGFVKEPDDVIGNPIHLDRVVVALFELSRVKTKAALEVVF